MYACDLFTYTNNTYVRTYVLKVHTYMYLSCTLYLLPSSCSLSLPESSATALLRVALDRPERWQSRDGERACYCFSWLPFYCCSFSLLSQVLFISLFPSFLSVLCTYWNILCGVFRVRPPQPPPPSPYLRLLACLWLCVALREGGRRNTTFRFAVRSCWVLDCLKDSKHGSASFSEP
jgi:hypothetical protein